MAAVSAPPRGFSMITINGEEYMPTPHEVNPEFPENMVWTSCPWNEAFLEDPEWYDALGQDLIKQRKIWAVPTESGQVDQFRQLLQERPDRALNMMFAAAAKGKPHVVRFLLEQGVKATANKAEGDDETLVPLHAAAYQGRFECVKILLAEGKLQPDTPDERGGTPLMRACWGKRPEIVEYLLDAGADITIRQISSPENEPGPSAFEFAAGSGCDECAKLIIKFAEQRKIHAPDLVTPTAVAAAASSENLQMLTLAMEVGGYPRRSQDDVLLLTDQMKDAIEGAFRKVLRQGRYKALETLFAYIESRKENGEYHWTSLKDETTEDLESALYQLAEHNDEEHQKVLVFIHDILLAQNSRFTTPGVQEKKENILNDAFFWAARHGCLDTMKLIESKHEKLDVNHLSLAVGPKSTTPLYIAAGSGHNSIVEYLFTAHGKQLNVHIANGLFANGPTALWITVWNGHADTAKLLLEKGGGPINYIDEAARPGKQMSRVILTATKGFRSPVKLVSEMVGIKEHGDLDEAIWKGSASDEDGNAMKYVVLKLDDGDAEWWNTLQLRKNDEELVSMEKDSRPLKEKPITS